MKAGREDRVPLPAAAAGILEEGLPYRRTGDDPDLLPDITSSLIPPGADYLAVRVAVRMKNFNTRDAKPTKGDGRRVGRVDPIPSTKREIEDPQDVRRPNRPRTWMPRACHCVIVRLEVG